MKRRLTPMQEKVLRSLPREYSRWWAPVGWLHLYGLIEMEKDTTPPSQVGVQRGIFRPTEAGLAWLAE